jgi:hypothetical protein
MALVVGAPGAGPAAVAQDGDAGAGGEVTVKVTRAGLGRARPGDWTSFEVAIFDKGEAIRTVLVSLDIKDADGDGGLHERAITTKPNATLRLWLYARLPFNGAGDVYSISAYLAKEKEGAGTGEDAGKVSYAAGRLLGTSQFKLANPVTNLVSPRSGLIAVVGRRSAGLEQYGARFGSDDFSPTGHELTELVSLEPPDLPDRYQGLMALEAIAWTGGGAEEQPGKLSEQQSQAIREWVWRGGHLVVVLPLVGQTWLGGASNPLADIMPLVDVTRREGVDLGPYRYLLTTDEKVDMPAGAIVHSFTPAADAGPWDAMSILNEPAPGNQAVVVRRPCGLGAVTVVGVDLPSLAQSSRVVHADVIWHRILGKRHELRPIGELVALRNDGKAFFRGGRNEVVFDEIIGDQIEKKRQAAGGLLLALVVFGALWLMAGPVGFFLLKQRKLVHHAWVAFVAVVAVFTAVAWTGATALRQTYADGKHLTFLDHVYGQPVQRARAWVNLFLPKYGEQRVTVGDPAKDLPRWHQTLASWDPPNSGRVWNSFPDVRGYQVDARSPGSMAFPSRSTVKQVQVDWVGAPRWKMPLPQQPAGAEGAGGAPGEIKLGQEIRLVRREAKPGEKKAGDRDWGLEGSLVHDLPGDLKDVVIVVVRQQAELGAARQGVLPAMAYAFRMTEPWQPGKVLDLGVLSAQAGDGKSEAMSALMKRLVPTNTRLSAYDPTGLKRHVATTEDSFTALAFYSMLEPPDYRQQNDDHDVCFREASHTYDLGRWFTQPCVMIVGKLEGAECPIPISVDGQPIPTEGTTVVRWVYPLPTNPPAYRPPAPVSGPGDGSGSGEPPG